MGKWTPLVLMAGGVAILAGTLLGINFPMGGDQSANVPPERRASGVLPANINVNTSAPGEDGESAKRNNQNNSESANNTDIPDDVPNTPGGARVAQSNSTTGSPRDSSTTQDLNNSDGSSSDINNGSESVRINRNKRPIRALW